MEAVQFCQNTTPKRIGKGPYWYYRVYIPTSDGSKRQRQWVSSGTTNYEEACSFDYKVQWLREKQEKYKREHLQVATLEHRTLGWLHEYVIAIVTKTAQPKTVAGYNSAFTALTKFIANRYSTSSRQFTGEEIMINQITTELCRAFLDAPEARKAPVQYQRHYSNLRTSFNYPVREGLLARNPFDPIKKPKVATPTKDWFLPNNTDFWIFAKSLPNKSFADKSFRWMVELARFTGMRRNEVCNVLDRDIYLDTEDPYVMLQSSEIPGQFRTKNGKPRKIPLFPEAVSAILGMRRLKAEQENIVVQTSPYLFPGPRSGKTWDPHKLSDRFNEHRQKLLQSRSDLDLP